MKNDTKNIPVTNKKFEKPEISEVKFSTQSTTVLGNCTHYEGGNDTVPLH